MANCPFITPITENEFKLYFKFVNTDDFNDRAKVDLTNYELYGDEREEYKLMPDCFSFENTHNGNNKYLLLPILSKEIEESYRLLWREEHDEELEKIRQWRAKAACARQPPMLSTKKEINRSDSLAVDD